MIYQCVFTSFNSANIGSWENHIQKLVNQSINRCVVRRLQDQIVVEAY